MKKHNIPKNKIQSGTENSDWCEKKGCCTILPRSGPLLDREGIYPFFNARFVCWAHGSLNKTEHTNRGGRTDKTMKTHVHAQGCSRVHVCGHRKTKQKPPAQLTKLPSYLYILKGASVHVEHPHRHRLPQNLVLVQLRPEARKDVVISLLLFIHRLSGRDDRVV